MTEMSKAEREEILSMIEFLKPWLWTPEYFALVFQGIPYCYLPGEYDVIR